jgi:integrase
MLKRLEISDIDPIISALEQGYSDKGHILNALSHDTLFGMDEDFIERYLYIAQATNNEQRLVRFSEVVAGLTEDNKWPFIESFSTVIKAMSFIDNDSNEHEGLENEALQLLNSHHITADPNSLPYRVFLSKLEASKQIRDEVLSSIFKGDAIGERELKSLIGLTPISTSPTSEQPEKPKSPLFSQVYAEYINHKIKKDNLSEKMQKAYERYYIVWNLLVEDKPIHAYTSQDIGRFVDRCFELPLMNISPYRNMTWEQRLNVDVKEEDLQSPKSVQQYYKWIMVVFSYAQSDTVSYIQSTPCHIKRNFKARTRGIFSDAELKIFLCAADNEKVLWKKWIIYLGIYTGARRAELAQLRINDVKHDKGTDRYYLLITDSHESQKLKTVNAKRKIPLHIDVINAGFIAYLSTCKERVFDSVNNAEVITGWMTRNMKKLEVASTNELDHIRSFHSFRHTFITKLMTEGVSVNLLQQIVGHEISSFGTTGTYTHKTDDIDKLVSVVDEFHV